MFIEKLEVVSATHFETFKNELARALGRYKGVNINVQIQAMPNNEFHAFILVEKGIEAGPIPGTPYCIGAPTDDETPDDMEIEEPRKKMGGHKKTEV